jgi:hypothetical protein
MPGMASKRNYDPSRASVGRIVEPDTGAAGRGDRAALPGCVDTADWRAGVAPAAPNGRIRRCNTYARGRSASKRRTSTGNRRAGKTVATAPSHAPPCVSQAELDNGAVSCKLRPVSFGSHLLDTKGDDIGASTVGAVEALSCNCLLTTIQRLDDRTDPAPPALMMSPSA